jgi:DNA-binding FrmR family transcriptional regulator
MITKHASHPDIIKRLKRAEGHLRSLIGMIENGRPCLELAQQLHAVEAAIGNAKRELIHDHIDHCLDDAVNTDGKSSRAALAEFKALSKYL